MKSFPMYMFVYSKHKGSKVILLDELLLYTRRYVRTYNIHTADANNNKDTMQTLRNGMNSKNEKCRIIHTCFCIDM